MDNNRVMKFEEVRELFVTFNCYDDGAVHVENDMNFIDRYYTNATTQEEFIEECKKYLESDRYKIQRNK